MNIPELDDDDDIDEPLPEEELSNRLTIDLSGTIIRAEMRPWWPYVELFYSDGRTVRLESSKDTLNVQVSPPGKVH